MKLLVGDLSPEVRALLARERAMPAVSPLERTRALARARAALLTPAMSQAIVSKPTRGRRLLWAAAAAAIFLAGMTVCAAAYELRARRVDAAPPWSARAVAPSAPTVRPAAAAVDPLPFPRSRRAAHTSQADADRAELALLTQARAALAREAFAATLSYVAEHARRFKHGRLIEEREALRVKALAGLGHTDEARQAADAFRLRFPRSVLLPAVSQMPALAP